jgi:hypothetical protein
VFAEVAAEFPRLKVPLGQRNAVKVELQRACKVSSLFFLFFHKFEDNY